MNSAIALSVMGRDRPGIISALSRLIYDNGCNILDSSMTILRREFAMIVLVDVPPEVDQDRLSDDLDDLSRKLELNITRRELSEEESAKSETMAEPSHIVTLLGKDMQGLVWLVSELLASHQVNITDLNTKMLSSGNEPLFAMVIEVSLPPSLPEETLQGELRTLAERLNMDITLKSLEAPLL